MHKEQRKRTEVSTHSWDKKQFLERLYCRRCSKFDQKSSSMFDIRVRMEFFMFLNLEYLLLTGLYTIRQESSRKQKFHAAPLSSLPDNVRSKFRTITAVQRFNKMFSVPLMCYCFRSFSPIFTPLIATTTLLILLCYLILLDLSVLLTPSTSLLVC